MTVPGWGIFARVFPTAAPATVAGAIAGAGYRLTQLNLSALGRPTIPSAADWDEIDPGDIRRRFADAGVRIWGLSCSYNMAHPDPRVRRAGTAAAVELIGRAAGFGATAVTLCTGSRNADRMWAHHPDNSSPAAWRDFRAELDLLLAAASTAGVILGVEPEPGNVVGDAAAGHRLLTELGADARLVGVIADAANLLSGVPAGSRVGTLEHAFTLLAESIVCLHAKDLVPWADTLDGRGVVDYGQIAALYRTLALDAPVIVQDVVASQASAARDHLATRFRRRPSPPPPVE